MQRYLEVSDEKVLRGAASLAILSLVARISILGMTTARSHNRPSRATRFTKSWC
ncbi:hypothetical protein ACEYW6_28080 [Nostoc sp. UIC 10607]